MGTCRLLLRLWIPILVILTTSTATAREALVVFGTAIRPKLVSRLQTTLKLATERPDARIVVTGGSAASCVPEGKVMARWLSQKGISRGRIAIEPRARHTGENADLVLPLLKRLGASRVTVVTSASHTRRAGFHMRAALREAGVKLKVTTRGAPETLGRLGRARAWWRESLKIVRDAGHRLKRRASSQWRAGGR